jgi:triacylglycerol esterase/lipase EstA (alpha/beta hydrolase family)
VPHHLLLVPGFFGFTGVGDFTYFGHVRDLLAEVGPPAGLDGEIRLVQTNPTASLRERAAQLAQALAELLDGSGGEVSLVGHSSGGLDARLVVSPGVSLPTEVDVERCARAVRAVVTVATPHHGTPVAHFFNNLLGQQVLKLASLSTIYSLRAGRLPVRAVLRMVRLIRKPGAVPQGVVEQILSELLADFSIDRRRALEGFFRSITRDQYLVAQITPAAMDLFNATTLDRPGVRYGCVITRARPPTLASLVGVGLGVYAQATHAAFAALHRISSRTAAERAPALTPSEAETLHDAFSRTVGPEANDGIVPTTSQLWGDPIAAVWADHLDVIGHFHRPEHVPPHFDWLASGTGFTRRQFERVWRSVTTWLAVGR